MKTPILKKQIIKIFQKFGLSKDHALISANALINAELVGAYGHGLSRLKMYCDRISKKVINPKPKIKIKKISSSISHIDGHYWQNEKDLKSYYNALIKNKLPIVKGYHSTTEDKIRGDLIKQLLCEFEVNLQQFSTRWSLNSFSQHFHDELQRLQPFIDDGLVKLSEEHLVITNPGKLLVRTIASCFDEYLNIHQMRYSRVI